MLNILEPNTEDLTTLNHNGNAKVMIKVLFICHGRVLRKAIVNGNTASTTWPGTE